MQTASSNVRVRGQTGNHMLAYFHKWKYGAAGRRTGSGRAAPLALRATTVSGGSPHGRVNWFFHRCCKETVFLAEEAIFCERSSVRVRQSSTSFPVCTDSQLVPPRAFAQPHASSRLCARGCLRCGVPAAAQSDNGRYAHGHAEQGICAGGQP
jgi:hypothetical protein